MGEKLRGPVRIVRRFGRGFSRARIINYIFSDPNHQAAAAARLSRKCLPYLRFGQIVMDG
jgi:hypothetical protein